MTIGQSQAERMQLITALRSGLLQQRVQLHALHGKRDAPGFNSRRKDYSKQGITRVQQTLMEKTLMTSTWNTELIQ